MIKKLIRVYVLSLADFIYGDKGKVNMNDNWKPFITDDSENCANFIYEPRVE